MECSVWQPKGMGFVFALSGMSAGCPDSMPHGQFSWRLWMALTAAHPVSCIKAQMPLSDWRTGIATNYGGVQDGRVGMPSCLLM